MKEFDYIKKLTTEDNRLSLLYVLHPEQFDEEVINNVCNGFRYLIGCNYSYVINKFVDNLKYIVKYNSNSKTIYTLQIDEYTDKRIQLSWHETSNIFNNYILNLFENVFPKLIEKVENDKDLSKLVTELKKLYNPKAIDELYNKISYKSLRENIDDVIIFRNGYLNTKTDEFTETIIRKFDTENQYINMSYDNIKSSSLSKDNDTEFILSILNKIFYNKINNSISLITGFNTCKFVKKITELFNTYVTCVSIKEYYKNDYRKKIILITSPDEVDLTKINNKMNNQHVFLCCGLKSPKIIGLLNVDSFNIFNVETDYFDLCNSTELLSDIISNGYDLIEPFSSNLVKESINCDCNSAEYFIRSCLEFDGSDEIHTEQELYKYYLTFCKNNKLNILTVTTLIQSLQSKNISADGDIGSRVFTGFTIK